MPESHHETLAGQPTQQRGRRLLRWLVLLLLMSITAAGAALVLLLQPTELEQEIRLDLVSNGSIGESARVQVLNQTDLVTFHRPPKRRPIAIVCIRDGKQFYLAQARCPRRGTLWQSNPENWLPLPSWPTELEIREFAKQQSTELLPDLLMGYLPPPTGNISFEPNRLSIIASDITDEAETNEGIDLERLAELLKNEVRYTGQFHLCQFAFAPFHEPRWIDPKLGLEEVREYIDYLQRRADTYILSDVDCEPLIETLETVAERLTRIDERGAKFYLLATDRKAT